jgi:membrane-associated phospholipid phosphatase
MVWKQAIVNLELRVIYPLMVGIWVIAHFVTNERAARSHRGGYSTKTVLDDAIPFMPDMAVFYFSGFILGNMAYFILGSTESFPLIAIGYGIQFVVSIALYLLYPCRIDRYEDFVPDSTPGYLLAAFQRTSKPFNSFPSMHVSFCLFCALSVWGFGSRSEGLIMIAWAVMVALSALLTRQHYVVEVLMGAALGVGAYLFIWTLSI